MSHHPLDNTKVQFKVVGLITSPEYQKVKSTVQMLHKRKPKTFLKPIIREMLEFDWIKYGYHLNKEIGSRGCSIASPMFVFSNNMFIGDDTDFFSYLEENYNFFPGEPDDGVIYRNLAIAGHRNYFKRDPELYSDLLPETCNRFMSLCINHPLKRSKSTYAGVKIHRVCYSGWMQSGDIPNDYTDYPDESFAVSHDRRGVLSLANRGRHTNGTQFFITFKPSVWMDGYYVAIGQLVEGYHVLNEVENLPIVYETPGVDIIIANCGVFPYGKGLQVRKDFNDKIAADLGHKWRKLKMELDQGREDLCTCVYRFLMNEKERLLEGEVDNNILYLLSIILLSSINKLQQPKYSSSQEVKESTETATTILFDLVKNVVGKLEPPDDILCSLDVPSDTLLTERFEAGLYSEPRITMDHANMILELCFQCQFFSRGRKRKDEQLIKDGFMGLNELYDKLKESMPNWYLHPHITIPSKIKFETTCEQVTEEDGTDTEIGIASQPQRKDKIEIKEVNKESIAILVDTIISAAIKQLSKETPNDIAKEFIAWLIAEAVMSIEDKK